MSILLLLLLLLLNQVFEKDDCVFAVFDNYVISIRKVWFGVEG